MAGNNQRGGNSNSYQEKQAEAERQALVVQPPRLPMPKEATTESGVTLGQWKALTDAVFPSAKTVDGVMLALRYCKSRNLDPFKRVVHVVPMWNSKLGREVETVWPGIGEMRTTAHRTKQHAGNDDCVFGRTIKQKFHDKKSSSGRNGSEPRVTEASCPEMEFAEWAQITVYKIVDGQRMPFVGPKVRFLEIFSGEKGLRVPNARWRQAPYQMLEKCAEAAALRRAFPEELGDEWSAEEMEGKEVRGMPTVDAQYHYVDAEEATGEEAVEVATDAERDMRGWDPDDLEKYMNELRGGMPKAPDLEALDHGMAANRERIESLPDVEAEEIRGLELQIRTALEEKAKAAKPADEKAGDHGNDASPADEAGQAESVREREREAAEPAAEQPADDGEPPYLRNFRLRVSECNDIDTLARLDVAEHSTLKKQPAWIASACSTAIAARRAEIEGAASA